MAEKTGSICDSKGDALSAICRLELSSVERKPFQLYCMMRVGAWRCEGMAGWVVGRRQQESAQVVSALEDLPTWGSGSTWKQGQGFCCKHTGAACI